MNLLLIFALSLLSPDWIPLSGEDAREAVSRINEAGSRISSIQADFTQELESPMLSQKAVSRGVMASQGSNLRWEYLAPERSLFIVNNENVRLKNSDGESSSNVNSNRMFKMMARLMSDSFTGRGIASTDEYRVRVYTDGKLYMLELEPLKKIMKAAFSSFRLYLDSHDNVRGAELCSSRGDKTTITFSNISYNKTIDSSVFTAE